MVKGGERESLKNCKNLKTIKKKKSTVVSEGVRRGQTHFFVKKIGFIKPMNEGSEQEREGWRMGGGVKFFLNSFWFFFFLVFHWWLYVPVWPSTSSHEAGPPGVWERRKRQEGDREIEKTKTESTEWQTKMHQSCKTERLKTRLRLKEGKMKETSRKFRVYSGWW